MGKQSRRKGKGGKKDHKERQLERRERVEEHLDRPDQNERAIDIQNSDHETSPILEGDRVWFTGERSDVEVPDTYRGIVKQVEDDFLHVVPLYQRKKGQETVLKIPIEKAFRDIWDWTVRFDVGENVLCNAKYGWVPATVAYHWPIYTLEEKPPNCNDEMLFYKCHLTVPPPDDLPYVAVPRDSDECIRKHPISFRFSVGDTVIISTEKAKKIAKLRLKEAWIEAVVSRVDVTGLHDYYAMYECFFEYKGRKRVCHLLKDDDMHICSAGASPRERLMHAIEQDCDISHIDFLVNSFGIDVSTFQDLVLAKAIEYASYNTLQWLKRNLSMDLSLVRDSSGNTILHQVALSPYILRFLSSASEEKHSVNTGGLSLLIELRNIMDERNKDGRTWLDLVVLKGDLQCMDRLFSPRTGMAWEISLLAGSEDDFQSLASTAHETKRVDVELVVQEFFEFDRLYKQVRHLSYTSQKDEDKLLAEPFMSDFLGNGAKIHAQRFLRFFSDFADRVNDRRHTGSIAKVVSDAGKYGLIYLFRLLIEADGRLLYLPAAHEPIVETRNEFGQPELFQGEGYEHNNYEELDLISLVVRGDNLRRPYHSVVEEGVGVYHIMFEGYSRNYREYHTWLECIKNKTLDEIRGSSGDLLEYRIALMEDDNSLAARLKVLEYMVVEKGQYPPNPLDVIRFRQCGVLRWMRRTSLLNLDAEARKVKELTKFASRLQFLNGRKIPGSVSVRCFLCFAAIEYDDLQSLQWLVEEELVSIESLSIQGWNVVHASAYFGRLEILLWLRGQESCASLVGQVCHRAPMERVYAAHIAIERGHLICADMLLEYGCPSSTEDGKSIESYANESSQEFVRKWGESKARPLRLARDLRKLSRLLSAESPSYDEAKHHIMSTKCMNTNTWSQCGVYLASILGPAGKTYDAFLEECLQCGSFDFSFWLCCWISFAGRSLVDVSRAYDDLTRFWSNDLSLDWGEGRPHNAKLDAQALSAIAVDSDDKALSCWLASSWARKVECFDPATVNPILFRVLSELHMEELSIKVRNKLLRADVLGRLALYGDSELRSELERGGNLENICEIVETIHEIATELAEEEGRRIDDLLSSYFAVTPDGYVNMNVSLSNVSYGEDHPIHQQILLHGKNRYELSELHRVLAIEGYHELTNWCLRHARPWDEAKEVEMTRIAAFCGHSKTVDLFLNENTDYELHSSDASRYEAALLGSAEAGRVVDLIAYMDVYDTVIDRGASTFHSLVPELSEAAVRCFFNHIAPADSPVSDNGNAEVLMALAKLKSLTPDIFLSSAVEGLLNNSYGSGIYLERFPSFFMFLVCEMHLEVWNPAVQNCMCEISKEILRCMSMSMVIESLAGENLQLLADWLGILENVGFDIQPLKGERGYGRSTEVLNMLSSWKDKQIKSWAQFEMLKNDDSLLHIREAVEEGLFRLDARGRGGMLATHVAAAYDQRDALEWLVDVKGLDLSAIDGQGRNVLQVAEASKAASTTSWIIERQAKEVISSFVATHFWKRLTVQRKRRMLQGVTRVQARHRGNVVRRAFRSQLLLRLEESQCFRGLWKVPIEMLAYVSPDATSWSSIREQQSDIRRAELLDTESMAETERLLTEATSSAVHAVDSAQKDDLQTQQIRDGVKSPPTLVGDAHQQVSKEIGLHHVMLERIHLTGAVVKWLKQGDTKYKEFFVKRMNQLAAGDRSKALAKRLKGIKSAVFETKLESGYRILWTIDSSGNLIVWFVCDHDSVSRLARLIDDSKNRSGRQKVQASALPEFQKTDSTAVSRTGEECIVLDPLGNVPLQLYEVCVDQIEEIANESWLPRLHLTGEERSIVEAAGTVLVLGRSGTGKTICICNRMDYDRQRLSYDSTFSQLFIARSRRLCRYVSEAVGPNASSSFTTFGELLRSLESLLPAFDDVPSLFLPSQHVDFARFRRDVYHDESPGAVDAMIVWTNIRSFIKGSIEAVLSPNHVLPLDEYIEVEKLGRKRCRLSKEQRKLVYEVFLRYQKYVNDMNVWDDCDRIVALLQRLKQAKVSEPAEYEKVRWSKIYVDEIQDYTQAECLLFFYLSGPGDLFLAGDPAQSVVEGVEFRFEEIRSVGYHIAGPHRRDLIPQKPRTVNINFRSHSGILNTAAAILRCLFDAFPDSAKQLKEDRGLFHGPRPGVFHRVAPNTLTALVSEKLNGAIVLTHDARSSYWKRCLGGYPLVYGIREAKGLEFKTVILLDFFREQPPALQKPWRDLLLGRVAGDATVRYPELKGQLKLLYTAVTRSIEQLFFAETSGSNAGDAFLRWLTTTSIRKPDQETQGEEALALRNNVDNVEVMVMTRDEWLVTGMDNAEMAENNEESGLQQCEALLDKAIYCFEQAQDLKLASKARTHRASLRFRSELLQESSLSRSNFTGSNSEAARLEVRASQLTERLFSDCLLLEAKKLCRSILPFLSPYNSTQLQNLLISKLPDD